MYDVILHSSAANPYDVIVWVEEVVVPASGTGSGGIEDYERELRYREDEEALLTNELLLSMAPALIELIENP